MEHTKLNAKFFNYTDAPHMKTTEKMTSAELLEAFQNGTDVTQYDFVKAKIRECSDVYKLRAMLLDTLENAKNAEELAQDLLDFYIEF